MRIRIDLAYDGAGFHGWAAQPGLRTVQGELEAALATALRLEAVPLTCAGRTDTGVHATGQVAHADLDAETLTASAGRAADPPLTVLARRINGIVGPDLRVLGMAEAGPGFDARFSALWRRYAYRLADHPAYADPLRRGFVLAWPRRLDEAVINQAARSLLGEHDFAAFCKPREGATTIRTLHELSWTRDDRGELTGRVVADAFCHHMVRSLVGCLIAVGEGRRAVEWPGQVLAAGVRDSAVAVVPAHGLTLVEVGYPPDDELAAQAEATRRVRTL